MNELRRSVLLTSACAVSTVLLLGGWSVAQATEPCDDFDECKVLIEINASDGDIGFHWLGDAGDLRALRIEDPSGHKIFENRAFGSLQEQTLTETFGESAEPLCWKHPDEEDDWEDIVTLRDFWELWEEGAYVFTGWSEEGEKLSGETELSYDLPAAPQDVDFVGGVISWTAGDDLGNCAPLSDQGDEYADQELVGDLVDEGIIANPKTVTVAAWEVVLEPDVDDGDPVGQLIYSVRVYGGISPPFQVTVPADYLASLPPDTWVKVEVGAIGEDDNATYTEEDGFCVNVSSGCTD
jgi:hypothetical protein